MKCYKCDYEMGYDYLRSGDLMLTCGSCERTNLADDLPDPSEINGYSTIPTLFRKLIEATRDLRARVAMLEERSVPTTTIAGPGAPIDLDTPRRFRWPHRDHGGEWHYACFFPRSMYWTGPGYHRHYGPPEMDGVEWLDPAPAPKGAMP